MMYKQIECPTCGNVTTAKSIHESQKCQWCRRLFKVTITKKSANGKKNKFNWSAESVDFDDEGDHPRVNIKSLKEYEERDIYG